MQLDTSVFVVSEDLRWSAEACLVFRSVGDSVIMVLHLRPRVKRGEAIKKTLKRKSQRRAAPLQKNACRLWWSFNFSCVSTFDLPPSNFGELGGGKSTGGVPEGTIIHRTDHTRVRVLNRK